MDILLRFSYWISNFAYQDPNYKNNFLSEIILCKKART